MVDGAICPTERFALRLLTGVAEGGEGGLKHEDGLPCSLPARPRPGALTLNPRMRGTLCQT